MIDFQQHELRITQVNVRTERHGDDEVLAMDLKCETDLPNMALDRLDDDLRPSLFRTDADPDLLGKDAGHMPNLKFPQLGPLTWNGSISPVSLALHIGTKKNEVLLTDAKLNKLRVTPREGGTCGFAWRLQVHPNEDEAAKIMTVLKHTIKGTLDVSAANEEDEDADDD
ncbi:hypothetical protein AWB80_02853 [Caballeronia pedi]|uniref:Uncharacterized protein n=1 Tax=Caballeronia pedi TaxID=1777141 RepID=A0A158B0A5_9BURK|nr:hypothetical protein [Caballeronia pedi]SAK63330.1 hypothetical protein AWB80_02853 [Caballeronia pedi]